MDVTYDNQHNGSDRGPDARSAARGPGSRSLGRDPLDGYSAEERRELAQLKRFSDWYQGLADLRVAVAEDPAAATRDFGLDIRTEQVEELITIPAELRASGASLEPDVLPGAARRLHEFLEQCREDRYLMDLQGATAEPAFATWRRRQVARCELEMGTKVNGNIMHAPFAVELSVGCTVGCWFCGVSAPAFDRNAPWSPEMARAWPQLLKGLGDCVGSSGVTGFHYWATDPLDNPDYERFAAAHAAVFGSLPQCTTAQPLADLARTRRLVEGSVGSSAWSARFSILRMSTLRRVFDEFTPEETLTTLFVHQQREAGHAKSIAGRARAHEKRIRAEEEPSFWPVMSIACVSGFLVNLPLGRVQLIAPCPSSETWPNGYKIVAEEAFDARDPESFASAIGACVASQPDAELSPGSPVRLRRGLAVEPAFEGFTVRSPAATITLRSRPGVAALYEVLVNGGGTVGDVVDRRGDGEVVDHVVSTINWAAEKGALDDEPDGTLERFAASAHNEGTVEVELGTAPAR